MTSLPHHDRFPYASILERPDFDWPGGARLAVHVSLNLEHFAFGEGLGSELVPNEAEPDVLNYAWREYGNRVGVWRLLELFDALELPVSVLANASIASHCPGVIDAFRARGDEIVGHGRTNSEKQGEMSEADERALIVETTAALTAPDGTRPRGWLGPWISQSRLTPDLLHEAGYTYLMDWAHDDQPVRMTTRAGSILSVPYPQELNDVPTILKRHATASDFADVIVDQFDEMLGQCAGQPLVMGIALHPFIVGQPYRLRHLRRALARVAAPNEAVWLARTGEIAAHHSTLFPAPSSP